MELARRCQIAHGAAREIYVQFLGQRQLQLTRSSAARCSGESRLSSKNM